ncbi:MULTISPECIES: bi-domain-containing oxidoreductase [unclassified Mammaliicoccus]|uniref:bi-domain-containing oxidoreductase n=1 Tax=unclassified Mammaliicoccus TaxID=2803851 RepID=UPI001EFA63AB|nr:MULTISPECIES: bi-domain-containing oxidoreductase [unclassified Mammaliicoccus]
MKQLINSFTDGKVSLIDCPKPNVSKNNVVISNSYSAISIGTEKMLIDFGKSNYLQKAKQQPEKVKQVIDKVKTDGIATTYGSIKSKMDQPIPLGYSASGIVVEVGENVTEFEVGDRVISNGSHAEIVSVNKNLVAKIPDNINMEEAAFSVISSIPLQGIRLLETEIGETVVVTGLGLMGLLASQILIANGCTVIATDYDSNKVDLAKTYGVDAIDLSTGIDIVNYVQSKTGNNGADKVLITASTKSNDPIEQAAEMLRKRGKVVLVGVVGLELDRTKFYEKEITFQVSCSYGPGRYDENYEVKGQDYPIGFVRWTENRNFQTILQLLSSKKLDIKSILNHQYKFSDATEAYEELSNNKNIIGATFKYDRENIDYSETVKQNNYTIKNNSNAIVGIIGAGNFVNQTLLPKLGKKYRIKSIASQSGLSSSILSKKYKIEYSTTNSQDIIKDNEINSVIITTRHNTHFELVKSAIEAEKAVFVEKPIALKLEEVNQLKNLNIKNHLMIGFNRRFSPLSVKVKELLASAVDPMSIIINVNAGTIPKEHWTQNKDIGGGRLIGEACHFVDLALFYAGSKISSYKIVAMEDKNDTFDTFSILLKFENGSIATINYFANGNKSLPKEHITIYSEKRIIEIDNFIKLRAMGFKGFKSLKLKKQDKGHGECINQFLESVNTNNSTQPIPVEDIFEVSKICIELDEYIRNQKL